MRKKRQQAENANELQVIEPVLSSKAYRKKWAALIQKVWGTDPLLCPKCGEKMGIVAFIEDHAVIKKILTYLDLWAIPERPPPKTPPPGPG